MHVRTVLVNVCISFLSVQAASKLVYVSANKKLGKVHGFLSVEVAVNLVQVSVGDVAKLLDQQANTYKRICKKPEI